MIGVRLRATHVVVSGSDVGDEFYEDDNGNLWRYEKRGLLTVEQRAYTNAYGGKSTPWFELDTFATGARDKIRAWIDANAPSAPDWWSGDSGGGGSTDRPKSAPKSSPGTPGSTVKPSTTYPSPAATKASPVLGSTAVFVLLGAIGAGLLVYRYVG